MATKPNSPSNLITWLPNHPV
uniref:Uncharacterized protein n=1 Tax=Arundo donax TaxID=35708 RepID=A0A0A9GT44_ARUDO